MKLRVVNHTHYLLSGRHHDHNYASPPPKQLTSLSARNFWEKYLEYIDYEFDQAHAVVITDSGKIIAFFRYILHDAQLTACGTWVSPKYRRRGLGIRMWTYVLKRNSIKQIGVYTASMEGVRLVKKTALLYPNIVWTDY